jgi:purine-binding chemotaxis protein CheW
MDTVAVREGIDQTQCLSFHVAGEEYAIGILQVKEIIEYDEITMVPKTPPSIRGVINLRGSVVPVVDLAVKFGLPATGVTKRTCIVIVEVDLEGEPTVMGVMADAVSQVIEFQTEDIEAPPSFGTGVDVDYLRGMGKVGKKFVLLLDIDKVLSAEELEAVASLQASEEEAEATTQPEGEATVGEEASAP